jgi:tetratricopeptide (TPR) repeat protein
MTSLSASASTSPAQTTKITTPTTPTTTLPLEVLPPDQEAELLQTTHATKAVANKSFTSADYVSAIQGYQNALLTCPTYLEYDLAVLHSNIAACYLKQSEWKQAVDSATLALEALDRVDPPPQVLAEGEKGDGDGHGHGHERIEAQEVDDANEVRMAALSRTNHTIQSVHTLRTKALLRRALARSQQETWSTLESALADYNLLATSIHSSKLSTSDRRVVKNALATLPGKMEGVKKKEVDEMMGKLKQLGNGILKPFGLSTENFNFIKDEGSGGYSMQFNK